jgi:putative MFS transporter
VVVDTYVTEIVPSHARGRYVAITQVAGFIGVPMAAILSRWLVPTHFLMAGWRWVMVVGASGALLTWWFRRRLPESPRWLESQGRIAEADTVLRTLEAESFSAPPAKPTATIAVAPASSSPAERGAFAELWRPPYLRRTVMLILFQTLQTIGFYGFGNWAPTFLMKRGFSLVHSLQYTMLIALVSPVGPILCAWTSDRLERKWTIVVLALLVAVLGLGFGNASTPMAVVAFGSLLTLCNYWFSAAFHAFQAEVFPTRIRATGVGFTYSWSRLSAAFSSLLIGAVLLRGVPAVFALLAAAMTAVAVIVAMLGPRTNRVALEELSA